MTEILSPAAVKQARLELVSRTAAEYERRITAALTYGQRQFFDHEFQYLPEDPRNVVWYTALLEAVDRFRRAGWKVDQCWGMASDWWTFSEGT